MLSNVVIMIIVIVACLSATALGAGIASHLAVHENQLPVYDFPHEQREYMQSIRRNYIETLLGGARRFSVQPPRQVMESVVRESM
ncbi:hypothetical protein BDW59DRAFT_164989 [Aspergillus cavernicola]|uniref:Uncharacterized protein n=1 Tax=Aspergillus cavernicola TaxID=176166 RepID=A0ABR4HVZ1_9EURO